MKKILLGLGAVLGIGVLFASSARAGNKASYPISVSSTTVHGQVANIRATSNSSEFITCWVDAFGWSPQAEPVSYTTCIGRNSAGVSKTCYSSEANLATAALGIKGDSYIEFGTNVGDTTCGWIQVENGSTMAPKAP